MGVKEKQWSNEVFDDRLGWPLYLVVMEVQWFHKKTPLSCRSLARSIKGERDLVVAGFCDVISRLCFDLHFVWTGEDAADVRTMRDVLPGRGQSQVAWSRNESGWGRRRVLLSYVISEPDFILVLNSVFLGQMQSASMSRNVQLNCPWELLEEVHDYNDPSMGIQLLFCKGQKLWKCGDSLDNNCFQNWLPGLLEPNTDVHMCFSFFPEVLPYRRIFAMVWKEMIKGENE